MLVPVLTNSVLCLCEYKNTDLLFTKHMFTEHRESITFLSLELNVRLRYRLGPVADGIQDTLEQFPTMLCVTMRSADIITRISS